MALFGFGKKKEEEKKTPPAVAAALRVRPKKAPAAAVCPILLRNHLPAAAENP